MSSDWRARIRPMGSLLLNSSESAKITSAADASSMSNGIYGPPGGDNILSILHQTNGLLFPYTPSVTVNPSVEYHKYAPIHANADWQTFVRNQSPTIQINGTFTAQTPDQAHYTVACIHFLRSITKMRFGALDPKKGTPPPMLLFDAYGFYMFNQLPIILKGFTVNFENSSDYVPIDMSKWSDGHNVAPIVSNRNLNSSSLTWVPAKLTISMDIVVQIQPRVWRKEFNLDKFRSGELLNTPSKYTKRTGGWL